MMVQQYETYLFLWDRFKGNKNMMVQQYETYLFFFPPVFNIKVFFTLKEAFEKFTFWSFCFRKNWTRQKKTFQNIRLLTISLSCPFCIYSVVKEETIILHNCKGLESWPKTQMFNLYILAIWWCKPLILKTVNSVRSNTFEILKVYTIRLQGCREQANLIFWQKLNLFNYLS